MKENQRGVLLKRMQKNRVRPHSTRSGDNAKRSGPRIGRGRAATCGSDSRAQQMHQFNHRIGVQLVHDAGPMVFDGPNRQAELVGDLAA